jgi:aspartate racemase
MTMRRVGVLGGLGPAATVDFLDQLVRLTPARRDQDHLPVLAAFLPQVPDRSAAILGQGPDPLPGLLEGIALLNQGDVGVIAIPCNSAHHWYAQLSARSKAPILHIARACVQRLQLPPGTPVLVLGTRGVQRSGLYAQALRAVGLLEVQADDLGLQDDVDRCIAQVKAGERQTAADTLMQVLAQARAQGLSWVILGCTELPVAARACERLGPGVIDSTRALAEAVIAHGGAALAGPGVEGHP